MPQNRDREADWILNAEERNMTLYVLNGFNASAKTMNFL